MLSTRHRHHLGEFTQKFRQFLRMLAGCDLEGDMCKTPRIFPLAIRGNAMLEVSPARIMALTEDQYERFFRFLQ